MNERRLTTERIIFDHSIREAVLAKTHNKCAHCGAGLGVTKLTIDHIIPLSKGGTNDIKNLIALCEDCNKAKDNTVMHPSEYYAHVDEELQEEIAGLYNRYCTNVSWFGPHSFTREEKTIIEYYQPISWLSDYKPKMGKGKDAVRVITQNGFLSRLHLSDVNTITDYVYNYHKRLGLTDDKSAVREAVMETFSDGTIYEVSNSSGVIAYIPVRITDMHIDGRAYYTIFINGLPHSYDKPQHTMLLSEAISYILACVCEGIGNDKLFVELYVPEQDKTIKKMLTGNLFPASLHHSNTLENGDVWTDYVLYGEISEGEFSPIWIRNVTDERKKSLESNSKVFQRIFNLRKLNIKNDLNNERKERIEQKRRSHSKAGKKPIREYDEYDIEYYK